MDSKEYFTTLDESNPFSAIGNQIVERELAGKPVSQQPVALLTFGAPGAGKTTLLATLAEDCGGEMRNLPPLLLHRIQQRSFSSRVGAKGKIEDALYVSAGTYREEIARDFLMKQGASYEGGALSYVQEHFPAEARQINKTGGEIAKILLLQAVERGIHCVLDSTGGGFAPPADTVTIPLLEAAKIGNTQLIFIGLDVAKKTALDRVQEDFNAGAKPSFNPDRIIQDIANTPLAIACVNETAFGLGFRDRMILQLDEELNVDLGRSKFPWLDRIAGNNTLPIVER